MGSLRLEVAWELVARGASGRSRTPIGGSGGSTEGGRQRVRTGYPFLADQRGGRVQLFDPDGGVDPLTGVACGQCPDLVEQSAPGRQ